ncbi:IclR family transcriptional regulator [Halopelagius longus]|uniref:IclR family transcriptional regulator n=1 Tax=Halopelagius longus TaxID=1236180 RepID=A0A1H1FE42_9EURY|nr:IclR family transcriptional regulator [Halopelagius longus]RDI70150.1 IclR family transcriptional regulator [Halopelagius longus]SDQ99064.1 transcriptional regulator, IclR family [Halopelagius longus]
MSEYTVAATRTSLRILETLVESDDALGVTALSERVGVAKSVAHNHLSTLRACGYVVEKDGTYEPSLRTLNLGVRTRARTTVYDGAREKVDALAEATGETATLFVLEADRGVPAYVSEVADGWSPEFRAGERMPLHLNAPGKSLLASLSEDRLTEILDRSDLTARTQATITDRDELEAELRRIRDNGFSFCRGEQFEGIVGVAAAVPNAGGDRTAAVGVCGPADRLNGRYLEEDITGQVLSTTKSIQVDLTGE